MQYPLQTYKIKRSQQTLGVDYQLFAPDDTPECDASPLEMHNGFSRFVVTLVDKSNATVVTPKANIPSRDLACIALKTEIAMHELLRKQSTVGGGQASSEDALCSGPAFTNTMPYGEFKGKTPAAILIESPAAKDNLIKFKQSLQSNLEKYPGNKKHIDAIEQAIQLLDIGELSSSAAPTPAPTSVSFPIYKTEFKHMSAKDENGNNLIYTINIRFDSGRTYPFTLEITNCYAPLSKSSAGLVQPVMEKATRAVKSSVSLTDNEWVGMIAHLKSIKEYFELTNFKPMLQLAQKYAYQHN